MKNLLTLTLFLLLLVPAHSGTGGPDGNGYTWIDSNEASASAPEYEWVNISGSGDEKLAHGAAEKGIYFALDGPRLSFYGGEKVGMMVSKNGYITFTSADSGENSANVCPIPSAQNTDSDNRLMVLHDNLDFAPPIGVGAFRGRILYQYFPESPHPHHSCGVHVVTWENMVHMGASERFSFQVLLFDNFDILYQFGANPENGSGSSTGIQQASVVGLEVACDAANSIPDNYAVLIEPPTVTVETLEDTINGAQFSFRDALGWTQYGKKIVFDPSLSGRTILLDPALPVPGSDTFQARSIDASALANGITISGGRETPIYRALDRTHFSNVRFLNGAPETDGGGETHGGLSVSRLSETDANVNVTLSNCRFHGNTSDNGGALFVDTANRAYLVNCEFYANSADEEGGAIFADTSFPISASRCSFSSNSAQRGGAIYTINPNSTSFRLEDCSFEWNTAHRGGGIYYDNPVVPSTRRCLFAFNESTGRGGAIFAKDVEILEFYTCTFSSNSGSEGSAFYQADSPGALTSTKFRYSTFANNSGTNLDGASGVEINVGHCVFSDLGTAVFFGGDPTCSSSGFNIADRESSILIDEDDLTNTDPMLARLAANGGPTRTHALSVGSPAIDAGESQSAGDIDQRGYTRVVGGVIDIGAYEFQGNIVVTTAVDELADPGAGVSLREAVRDIAPGAQISFDPSLDGATINLTSGHISISSDMAVDASALADGIAIDGGGANRVFNVFGAVSLSLHNLDLVGGSTSGSTVGGGGLLVATGAAVSMFDSSVRGCTSDQYGGGIAVQTRSDLWMVDCLVSGNETTGVDADGGGIYVSDGGLELQRTTVGNNVSSGDGGGIRASADSYVDLRSCTIAKNTAAGSGGGFSSSESDGLVGNSTISGNVAGGSGGAFNGSNSDIEFQFSTIANNRAASTAGGIVTSAFQSDAHPTLTHCIVAANRLVGTGLMNIRTFNQESELESRGYNLIDDDSLSSAIATDLEERVAYLAPLANYGSDLQTHALLSISPAIDAGDPTVEAAPGKDQRGYDRIVDGRNIGAPRIDIGAHEAAAPVFVGDLVDVEDGVGQRSLRGAIAAAEDGGRIIFRQSLNGGVIDLSTAAGGQGSRLLIDKSIQIDATSLSDGITVSGGDETGVFDVTGGVSASMHALRIEDGFSGAGVDGGGVRVAGNSDLLMTHCSLSGNRGTYGGGIHARGGSEIRLQNVTLSGNTAQLDGGALGLSGTGTRAVLEHCTIATNQSNGGTSGGVALADGKLTMYSSVIADNGGINFSWNDFTNFTSLGYNLTDDPGALVGGLFVADGDISSTNPNLNALANVGGWSECAYLRCSLSGEKRGRSGAAVAADPFLQWRFADDRTDGHRCPRAQRPRGRQRLR